LAFLLQAADAGGGPVLVGVHSAPLGADFAAPFSST